MRSAEIRKADDWGSRPPHSSCRRCRTGEATPRRRADAEVKLGLAILKYARHARGGRLDPPSISQLLDRKPNVYDPKTLIQAIAVAEAADAYLRDLHPKHAQFRNLHKALLRGGAVHEPDEPAPARRDSRRAAAEAR